MTRDVPRTVITDQKLGLLGNRIPELRIPLEEAICESCLLPRRVIQLSIDPGGPIDENRTYQIFLRGRTLPERSAKQ